MLLSLLFFYLFVGTVGGIKFFFKFATSKIDNKVKDIWLDIKKSTIQYKVGFAIMMFLVIVAISPIVAVFEFRSIIKSIKNGKN